MAEFLSAAQIEAETDVRFAGLLVKALLRVDEILAVNHDSLLHLDRAATLLHRQRLGLVRRVAGICDKTELKLGGLADHVLQRRRVLAARRFDQHAVRTLLLDDGLLGAHRVDAAVQHLDRLPDRVTHLVGDCSVRQRQPHAIGGLRHIERSSVSSRERATDRLAQRLEKIERLGALARIGDADNDCSRLNPDAAGDPDLALAQLLPHVVAQRLDLRLDHGGRVDFHQQVGAALQIEAKHDLAQRYEAGEARGERVDCLSRHKARQDDQNRGRHERQDRG